MSPANPEQPEFSHASLQKELSNYWYCPKDENLLQIRLKTRYAQNTQFMVTRKNMEVGITNAISMKKIPPEMAQRTAEIAEKIFSHDSSRKYIEFVGATCKKCGATFSAPKIDKILNVVEKVVRDYKYTCPVCRNGLEKGTITCPYCGYMLR